MRTYDCNYSKFNIEKHKNRYVDYLEVMIGPDGDIDYAHPSHQIFAESKACEKLGLYQREHLWAMISPEAGFLEELLKITGYIAVWRDFYIKGLPLTELQIKSLNRLKSEGLYKGVI